MTDRIRHAFEQQIIWCDRLGSPFTARLCAGFARHLDRELAIGRRLLDWPAERNPIVDAVPLRVAGGLHALVRRGRLPELARLYPSAPLPDIEALWAAVARALVEAEAELLPWLDRPPQTNEIGRSALLMSGLLAAAAETGLPIALYEVGASAGLNLQLDRYRYRLGGLAIGPADAGVLLAPDWTGASPPAADIHVARRRGADLNPIDMADARDRERLLAYIWPDQTERLDRTEAALALAVASPPPLDCADAADWTERQFDPTPERGMLRVLMHSIAFQYFPAETRRRLVEHLDRVGRHATGQAPLAWLRFEIDPEYEDRPSLRTEPIVHWRSPMPMAAMSNGSLPAEIVS
jgi:hypothetical protein